MANKSLPHEYGGPQNHDVETLSSSISFTLIYVVFISVSFHLLSFFFYSVEIYCSISSSWGSWAVSTWWTSTLAGPISELLFLSLTAQSVAAQYTAQVHCSTNNSRTFYIWRSEHSSPRFASSFCHRKFGVQWNLLFCSLWPISPCARQHTHTHLHLCNRYIVNLVFFVV